MPERQILVFGHMIDFGDKSRYMDNAHQLETTLS